MATEGKVQCGMATKKIHIKYGFEYRCERFSVADGWVISWYFRPVGAPFETHFRGVDGKALKADLETLLAAPNRAMAYYREDIVRQGDVAAAEARLKDAERRYEQLNAPDYDPGGSTNNPGRVVRALGEVKDSGPTVERAKVALDHAKRVQATL